MSSHIGTALLRTVCQWQIRYKVAIDTMRDEGVPEMSVAMCIG
jgi:hypothetical protein